MGSLSTPLCADTALRNSLLAVAAFDSFSDYPVVWSALVQIFVLVGALLLANILRRSIPFLRRSLIPSALLGGAFVLLLKLIPAVNAFIDNGLMDIITYHCLGLGFISQALKKVTGNKKGLTKSVIETGVLTGGVYSLQALLGIAITIILTAAGGFSFAAGGILLCLGYGQGTGQALSNGKIFESDYGFEGGATFGLSIAAIGFFVAAIVGVVYLNILRRKGKLRVTSSAEEGMLKPKLADYVGENEIPDSDSVDKYTVTLGIVLIVYAAAFGIMSLFKLGNIELVWGFNFLLGSLLALLTRLILNFFSKKKIIKQEPTNNYLLDRTGGFMFDMMIIAGVAAIDWHQFSSMWWQLLIICAVGAVATFVYIRLVANNIYKGYENEGFISMFGMMTGTASSGMILLREIDPRLETPASSNLVYSGLPAIVFGGGLLLLLGYCPKGMTQSIVTLAILFAAFIAFTLVLFRNKIFRRRKKAAGTAPAAGESAVNEPPSDSPPES